MSRTRRQHSAEFKSKVALEALKEHKTLAQLTEQYALHANQISEWKNTLQEGSPILFERGKTKPETLDLEALRSPYLEQIGAFPCCILLRASRVRRARISHYAGGGY
jgi:transposase-like protein